MFVHRDRYPNFANNSSQNRGLGPAANGDPCSMELRIDWLTIDSQDPARLARFWQAALEWERADDGDDPDEIMIEAPAGADQAARRILFVRVPERKMVKNRLHLDLRSADQDAEVGRLIALGATRADVGQADEQTWVVLADPDGNEFCVLRSA
jgi:predicted enzyme related to lactoylglutathione lyase